MAFFPPGSNLLDPEVLKILHEAMQAEAAYQPQEKGWLDLAAAQEADKRRLDMNIPGLKAEYDKYRIGMEAPMPQYQERQANWLELAIPAIAMLIASPGKKGDVAKGAATYFGTRQQQDLQKYGRKQEEWAQGRETAGKLAGLSLDQLTAAERESRNLSSDIAKNRLEAQDIGRRKEEAKADVLYKREALAETTAGKRAYNQYRVEKAVSDVVQSKPFQDMYDTYAYGKRDDGTPIPEEERQAMLTSLHDAVVAQAGIFSEGLSEVEARRLVEQRFQPVAAGTVTPARAATIAQAEDIRQRMAFARQLQPIKINVEKARLSGMLTENEIAQLNFANLPEKLRQEAMLRDANINRVLQSTRESVQRVRKSQTTGAGTAADTAKSILAEIGKVRPTITAQLASVDRELSGIDDLIKEQAGYMYGDTKNAAMAEVANLKGRRAELLADRKVLHEQLLALGDASAEALRQHGINIPGRPATVEKEPEKIDDWLGSILQYVGQRFAKPPAKPTKGLQPLKGKLKGGGTWEVVD